MDPFTLTTLALLTLLGACIGSFANVVIYRLPAGKSLAHPPSSCPTCNRRLTPIELIPVLSWLAQGAKCRGCKKPISSRYPIVESLFALTFLGLALLTKPDPLDALQVVRYFAQAATLSLLLIATIIDIDTLELPDTLVYAGIGTGLLAATLPPGRNAPQHLLNDITGTLTTIALAAGALMLLERIAALALRRGRDTRERLPAINPDHIVTGALAAAIAGLPAGLIVAALHVTLDVTRRRAHRLPEPLLLALLPITLGAHAVLATNALSHAHAAVLASGILALAAGVTWWIRDARERRAKLTTSPANGHATLAPSLADDGGDPVAIGFGDIKLAGALAALLPNPPLLVLALLLSTLTGSVAGLAFQQRKLPYGPHLLAGTLLATTLAQPILDWYLPLIGLPG